MYIIHLYLNFLPNFLRVFCIQLYDIKCSDEIEII